MKLYIGLAGPALLIFYLPLVLIGLLVLASKVWRWKKRYWAIPLYLILAYLIPLGDVTWHSWKMNKACDQAGLHIYRTVVVDGFQGLYADRDTMKEHPYVFVEDKPFPGEKTINRFERKGDEIVVTKIPEPTAEWEIIRDRLDCYDKDLGVIVDGEVIRNRNTGEVIAKDRYFTARMGWIDNLIGSVIDNGAGGCYRRPKLITEFHRVLIPSGVKP